MMMVRTAATGKEMPVNPDPDAEGNVIIDDEGLAFVLKPGQEPLDQKAKRYMPHFATCPEADRFRRRDR